MIYRSEKVRLGDAISNKLLVEYGVSQGTVQGLFLFLYISMTLRHRVRALLAYADDTTILFRADTWNTLLGMI